MLGLGWEAGLFLKGAGSTAIQALWPRGQLPADQGRERDSAGLATPLQKNCLMAALPYVSLEGGLAVGSSSVHFLPHMGKDGEDSRAVSSRCGEGELPSPKAG